MMFSIRPARRPQTLNPLPPSKISLHLATTFLCTAFLAPFSLGPAKTSPKAGFPIPRESSIAARYVFTPAKIWTVHNQISLQTTVSPFGQSVMTLWRAVHPSKEDRAVDLECAIRTPIEPPFSDMPTLLGNPISRPYPCRWLAALLLAGSLIFMTMLATLNGK